MIQRYQRLLIPILLLVIAAAYISIPEGPGIHINLGPFSINHDFKPRRGLDLVGGVQALLEADLPSDAEITSESMNTARAIVENRVNALGTTDPVVQLAGDRRILVEMPDETDPAKALEVIRQTGLLEFVEMGDMPVPEGTVIRTDFAQISGTESSPNPGESSSAPTDNSSQTTDNETAITDFEGEVSPGTAPIEPQTENVYHTVMTGTALRNVAVYVSPAGQFEVSFQLTDEGARIFGDYTTRNVGKYLAIVLDKQVISAPVINSPITEGSGVIQGNFTQESANALAVQLRYGSLPIPLTVVTSQTVGPTLGQDSLQKSLVAGAIGLAIVMLFMALYYRLPGILANIALLIYALVTYALFILIPVTLTLPGIAGFILSIGVAVDANILIFERLKEELRSGRTLGQAIDLGWNRAWPSIRDSNFSTLITCGILFWFGSTYGASIVKGFSLTLAIGVLVSMFTAIIVTRTFLHVVLGRLELAKRYAWFGVTE